MVCLLPSHKHSGEINHSLLVNKRQAERNPICKTSRSHQGFRVQINTVGSCEEGGMDNRQGEEAVRLSKCHGEAGTEARKILQERKHPKLDGPEILISTTPRLSILRRSTLDPNVNQFLQDTFSSRKISKVIDPSSGLQGYDRKIKNLIEKTPYIKPETSTLLKPEEVLSCRYLRLSKNNIQTLLRLCKEAGMEIDIHPHMNESEMNANKIFTQKPSIAL
uniref:Uncharacterized protein n=1 Tax=Sarcophilus harrisii TaxID=9305 RepID=G3X0U6_SARHA